jgi:hypothetical protein
MTTTHASDAALVNLEIDDAVAMITLNRPELLRTIVPLERLSSPEVVGQGLSRKPVSTFRDHALHFSSPE